MSENPQTWDARLSIAEILEQISPFDRKMLNQTISNLQEASRENDNARVSAIFSTMPTRSFGERHISKIKISSDNWEQAEVAYVIGTWYG
jgi:hypothetical protein